jgi:hypothetical protein
MCIMHFAQAQVAHYVAVYTRVRTPPLFTAGAHCAASGLAFSLAKVQHMGVQSHAFHWVKFLSSYAASSASSLYSTQVASGTNGESPGGWQSGFGGDA